MNTDTRPAGKVAPALAGDAADTLPLSVETEEQRKKRERRERKTATMQAFRERHKEREVARDKERYDRNKEYRLALARIQYEGNKAAILSYKRSYREKNKSSIADYQAAYRAEKGKKCLALAKSRRRLRLRVAQVETVDRAVIIDRDKGVCYLCGCHLQNQSVTLDHVVPLARGGTHSADNLRVACRRCNSRKGKKTLEEYFDYLVVSCSLSTRSAMESEALRDR